MNVTFIGSPNYDVGRGGKKISLIVVHHMAGTLAATDAVFQNTTRNTSAHYGIGRDGTIHQYVQEADTAFHAGDYNINQRSVGIEHEDLNANDYTELEYQTSATLIREICQRYGLEISNATIKPHRDFYATACPGTLNIPHLIELAQVAQGGDMVVTQVMLNYVWRIAFDEEPPQKEIDYWVGRSDATEWEGYLAGLYQQNEARRYKANNYDKDVAAAGGPSTVLAPGRYDVK